MRQAAHSQAPFAPALAAAGLIGALLLLGIGPVLYKGLAGGSFVRAFDPYFWRVLGFTLLQAGLSTLLSVTPAIAISRALHRRRFPGRRLLVALLVMPLTLPAIVAILGITEVYGPSGWLGGAFSLYGLTGILIAHAFFNLPLATRLMLLRLDAVPAESYRLSAQLGFSPIYIFRHLEWPAIKAVLPAITILVFLLCAASFAVVLVLGGGPQATTLEVAIYQALRLDFDPARASALALAQVMLCSVLVAAGGRALLSDSGVAISMPIRLSVLPDTSLNRWIDFTAIALLLLVVLPPTLAIVASGLMSWPQAGAVVPAALTSLLLGTAAALFALVLCWPLAAFAARSTSPSARTWSTMLSLSAWMLPPAVLATGWFIALLPFQIGILGTALLIAAMNALMALPFVYGNLWQAMADRAKQHDRLCASLGLAGWQRLRLVDLPSLKSPLMLASVMAFAVSLGDLAAVTLFGAGDITTLPALIYRQMGSYRMEQAAGTALFLAAGCLASMWAAEKWARKV